MVGHCRAEISSAAWQRILHYISEAVSLPLSLTIHPILYTSALASQKHIDDQLYQITFHPQACIQYVA